MKFSRPLWNPIWAGFCVRVPLGAYFLLAGRFKLNNLEAFIGVVKGYNILPDEVATLYAVALPFVEMLIGALLIVGLWTSLAAMIAGALLSSFVIALGLQPNKAELFNKDIILLGGALSLLASGAGFFSIDNFRAKG